MDKSNQAPKLLTVTDWIEKRYVNTGGTREKSFLESPEGDSYFFKTSLKKPDRDYKFEFWSEIIASKVGYLLNFNMLEYNIAIKSDKIGCISKSMINQERERLTEGVNYLAGYDNSYDPISKDHQGYYSYQYIKDALTFFDLERFIENIDEIIVFDALIGNGDRHQENWAIISEFTSLSRNLRVDAENPSQSIKRTIYKIRNFLMSQKMNFKDSKIPPIPDVKSESLVLQAYLDMNIRFAPIYDSGSSLGREFDDDALKLILTNKMRFNSYVNKGKSEIHWQGQKLKHWELLEQLLKTSERARTTINTIKDNFNEQIVESIIYNLDNDVPNEFKDSKLTEIRKEFLTKLITLRYKKLLTI